MSKRVWKRDATGFSMKFENKRQQETRKHEMPTSTFIFSTVDEAYFTWKSQSAWYWPDFILERKPEGGYFLKNTIVEKRKNGFIFKSLKTIQICNDGSTYLV